VTALLVIFLRNLTQTLPRPIQSNPEDGGNVFFRNVRIRLQLYTEPLPEKNTILILSCRFLNGFYSYMDSI
jgi:hypothetical protein